MRFGIRSALAIIAVYAVLFAVMRPFGALGVAVAVFSGTALGALIVVSEEKLARPERTWLLWAAVGVPLLIGCLESERAVWDGITDLTVEFTVSDAETGKPIPGAQIEIEQLEEEYRQEAYSPLATLVADSGGVARRNCPGTWCSGHSSRLRSIDTFYAVLPYWRFRALIDGCEPGEWINLHTLQFQSQAPRAERTSPGKSKVVVPVSLRKRQAKAGKARPTNVSS